MLRDNIRDKIKQETVNRILKNSPLAKYLKQKYHIEE